MKRLRLSEVSLRTRFILGMGVMLVPLTLAAVSTVFVFERMLGAIHDTVQEASEELAVLWRLQVLLERANQALSDCVIEGQDGRRCEAFRASRVVVDRAFERAAKAPFGLEEERALLEAAREHWERAGDIGDAVLARSALGSAYAGDTAELDAHVGRATTLLEQAHKLSEGEMAMSVSSARSGRRNVLLVVTVLLVFGVAVATGGATVLARSILAPIGALERGAAQFAQGVLSYRVPATRPPELNRLAATFNHMAETLSAKEHALAELSMRDALTNLYNRRELLRRVTIEVERSKRYGDPVVLLFLDLDGLKIVNDTHGHQAGDAVLARFATLVARAVRPTDIVGRYGGDEFAVVLPQTSRTGGEAMAERIREVLTTQWTEGMPHWLPPVTTSIGVAAFPDVAASPAELIRLADRAVYAAKQVGGNRVRSAGSSP